MALLPSICSQPFVAKLSLKNDKVFVVCFFFPPQRTWHGPHPLPRLVPLLPFTKGITSPGAQPKQGSAAIRPSSQPRPVVQADTLLASRSSCAPTSLQSTGLRVQICVVLAQLCHLQQCV